MPKNRWLSIVFSLSLLALIPGQSVAMCKVHTPGLQSSYEGDCTYGVAFGTGVAKGEDGSRYEGQFLGGFRSGQGTMHYVSGDIYTGQWKHDKRHGYGRYVYGEGSPWRGDVYEGYWQQDQMHGTGTYIFYPSGDRFEARWRNGGTDTIGTTTLARRKWAYESVAQAISQPGTTVCSVTTDGASPRNMAKGIVRAAQADRIQVEVINRHDLHSSTLQLNPRWDVITEWTRCQFDLPVNQDTRATPVPSR